MSGGTFLGFPAADRGSVDADVAILGIPHGVAYPIPELNTACADAPAAIRKRSARLARFVDNHDFDLDGPLLAPAAGGAPGGPAALRVVDCGDVPGSPSDGEHNARSAEDAVRAIVARGVVPLVLGGDDSVPIPVLRALDALGRPLTVLQVDAHLDFRDAIAGVRDGYSSPMRRASEMAHVGRIVQVGLRGVGSARPEDVAAARGRGNLLVTASELRRRGVAWLVEQLPVGEPLFVSFDLDGLDPSVCPAVGAPSPGGLGYEDAADLIVAAVRRCRLAGAAFTELVPAHDASGLSALVAVRLVARLIGTLARHSS